MSSTLGGKGFRLTTWEEREKGACTTTTATEKKRRNSSILDKGFVVGGGERSNAGWRTAGAPDNCSEERRTGRRLEGGEGEVASARECWWGGHRRLGSLGGGNTTLGGRKKELSHGPSRKGGVAEKGESTSSWGKPTSTGLYMVANGWLFLLGLHYHPIPGPLKSKKKRDGSFSIPAAYHAPLKVGCGIRRGKETLRVSREVFNIRRKKDSK